MLSSSNSTSSSQRESTTSSTTQSSTKELSPREIEASIAINNYLSRKNLIPNSPNRSNLSNLPAATYQTDVWGINMEKTYEWAIDNHDKALLALLNGFEIPYPSSNKHIEEAILQITTAQKLISNEPIPLDCKSENYEKEKYNYLVSLINDNTEKSNELLKLLIEAGIDLSSTKANSSLLEIACEQGNLFACQILIQEGFSLTEDMLANLFEKDINNGTQICTFIQKNDLFNESSEYTLLHHALSNKQFEVAQVLIENGACTTTVDRYGRPILIWAILQDVPVDIVKLLITPETANIPDREGYTPLHYAINQGQINAGMMKDTTEALKIIECLLSAGANPNGFFEVIDDRNYKPATYTNEKTPLGHLRTVHLGNSISFKNDVDRPEFSLKCKYTRKAIELIKHHFWAKEDFSMQEIALFDFWAKVDFSTQKTAPGDCLKEKDSSSKILSDQEDSSIKSLSNFAKFLINDPYKHAFEHKCKKLIEKPVNAEAISASEKLIEMLVNADIIDTQAILAYAPALSYKKEDVARFISRNPYDFALSIRNYDLLCLFLNSDIKYPDYMNASLERIHNWVEGKFSLPERKVYETLKRMDCYDLKNSGTFARFLFNDPYSWAFEHNHIHLFRLLVAAQIPTSNHSPIVEKFINQLIRWSNNVFTPEENILFTFLNEELPLKEPTSSCFINFLCTNPYFFAVYHNNSKLIELLLRAGIINTNLDLHVAQVVTKKQTFVEKMQRWENGEFTESELNIYALIKDEDWISNNIPSFIAFLSELPHSLEGKSCKKELIQKLILENYLDTKIIFEQLQECYSYTSNIEKFAFAETWEKFAEFLSEDPYAKFIQNNDSNANIFNDNIFELLVIAGIPNTNPDSAILKKIAEIKESLIKSRWNKFEFTPKETTLFKWMKINNLIIDEDDFVDFLTKKPYEYATNLSKDFHTGLNMRLREANIPE